MHPACSQASDSGPSHAHGLAGTPGAYGRSALRRMTLAIISWCFCNGVEPSQVLTRFFIASWMPDHQL